MDVWITALFSFAAVCVVSHRLERVRDRVKELEAREYMRSLRESGNHTPRV